MVLLMCHPGAAPTPKRSLFFASATSDFPYDLRTAYTGTAECEYQSLFIPFHSISFHSIDQSFWCRRSFKSTALRNTNRISLRRAAQAAQPCAAFARAASSGAQLSVTHSHATIPGTGCDLDRPQMLGLLLGYVAGWWLGHPSEKYEFVNWDDDSQYMGK